MKHVEFTVDGNILKGLLFLPEKFKEKNPAILFVHGWTGLKERGIQYAEELAKIGYISMLFNLRGHGDSEGNINTATSEEFLDDLIGAYDFLSNLKKIDADRIYVVGNSYGAYLSAILTEKRTVAGIVLRSPSDYPDDVFTKPKRLTSATDTPDVLEWRRQKRNSNDTYALRAISTYDKNILVIECGDDMSVPHETIQNYIDAVKDKSKLTHQVIPRAPHTIKDGPFKDQVTRILVDWFSHIL